MFGNYVGKFENIILTHVNFYIEPICLENDIGGVNE